MQTGGARRQSRRAPREAALSGEEVDEQLVNAFGLVVMDPMRRVGKSLDPVEVGYVIAVRLGEIGAEVGVALPPDHQRRRRDRTQLRPISAPTMVIWGQRDRYLGAKLAEPDRDDVPNLDRVVRLPDASHWVHHDEPERVTQLLIDFFAPARPTQ